MNFMNNLKNTMENTSFTENGMKGYASSGHLLVDMDYKISSYRNKSEEDILRDFKRLISEEPIKNVIKWMFYVRDIREGNGERRLFKIMLMYLGTYHSNLVKPLIPIIPEYGRWDDLFCLIETELRKEVVKLIRETLIKDLKNLNQNQPISLLAKWMPSINTSSEKTRKLANVFAHELNLTQKEYRKVLSVLRKRLDVVEKKMSNNEWSLINYESVPAAANLIYSKAFYNHDKSRREKFLESLKKGEKKINSQNLFPYQIYQKMNGSIVNSEKMSLEAMWKSKVDNDTKNINSTLVVCDTSGSMSWNYLNKTSVRALDISASLAIYFSEKNTGIFKDKYITFSRKPQFVDLSRFNSLKEKINYLESRQINENTDIYSVFKLILNTAINNNLKQEELPERILIISDMEFDELETYNRYNRGRPKDFESISKDFQYYGYNIPKLVFWNVMSRTNTIPIIENENGVFLISGFSDNRMDMIMSEQKDSYEALLETINSKRYDLVQEKLETVL